MPLLVDIIGYVKDLGVTVSAMKWKRQCIEPVKKQIKCFV